MADTLRDKLQAVPFAPELTEEQISLLLPQMYEVKVTAGKSLPDADQPTDVFYFVQSGHLQVKATDPTGNRTNYRDAGEGEYIGLYSLFTGLPAVVEATATRDSTLLAFPALTLHEYLVPGVQRQATARGEVLFVQDQTAEFLYFVLKGTLQLERQTEGPGGQMQSVRRIAGPGEYLGRYALITGETFRATATATQNTMVLAIPFRALQPLLFLHPGWREWFFPLDVAQRMRAIPLFKDFEDWDIYLLADEVTPIQFEPQDVIYSAADPAEHFYVIDRGQVEERPSGGQEPWYLAAGNYFGQDSLKGAWQRDATTTALKPTHVFRLPGRVVGELLQQRNVQIDPRDVRGDLVDRLRDIPLFGGLSSHHLRRLAGYVNLVFFRPGDIVARQGEPADKLMILHEGEAVVLRQSGRERTRPVRRLKARRSDRRGSGESEHFGARSLVGRETRGATVEVTEPSTWIVLERGDFQQFLHDVGLGVGDLGPLAPAAQDTAAAPLQPDELALPWKRRRHWIVAVVSVAPGAILAVAILAWLVLAPGALTNPLAVVFFAVRLLLFLAALFWAVWGYADWYNDMFVITSEAVQHIERELLTSEARYEAPLYQIQNVNLAQSVVGQLFGFGDVLIETAAAQGQVTFTTIPDPREAQDLIRRASDEAKSGRQVREVESIRQRLEDRLAPERLKPEVPGSVLGTPPPPPLAPTNTTDSRPTPFFLPPFEERKDGKITWRKHWFNLLQRTGLAVLATALTSLWLLTIVVPSLARLFRLDLAGWIELVAQPWLIPVVVLALILSILWLKYRYEEWKNDVYILTADEVIDRERELAIFPIWWLYSESRRAAGLSNVQYVDLHIPNLIAIIFNYGDVIVQTAGPAGKLDFLFVHNPRRVHATVLRRLAEFQEREREREFEERWQDMAQWLEAYHDVTRRGRTNGV